MDWLSFTAEIFKAAAWTAATVAIALMFRTQLRALLARMNRPTRRRGSIPRRKPSTTICNWRTH